MTKFFTTFLLVGLLTLVGCRSKCAPLDRSYPSQRDNNQSFGTPLPTPPAPITSEAENSEPTRVAISNCADRKLAFNLNHFAHLAARVVNMLEASKKIS